ncbi:T-lymphocyte surface antigen Ly-9 [Carlito syrichta]|uniref:T-lymphocyte surface antigen Ly-9 n=1 Tax=Carlito syrichta TaxID=1868482 RepID=A0A1U7TV19_CARSF|nr:T-lymphocyte surface antigen Ly-9 [Carlito syrichta]
MAGTKSHTNDRNLGPFYSNPQKSWPQIFSSTLWTFLLFLLMGLRVSGKDSSPKVVFGILGGSVTLPLNISVDAEIEHVTWNGPQNALALAYPNREVTIMVKSYQGRLNITSSSYSLNISNLTMKDAGSYKAQINQKDSKDTTEEKFTLHIYAQLPEPQVTMESVNMSENSSCDITLKCSVKGEGKDVLYSWTPRDTHASESNGGSILTISQTPCDPDPPYTCTARNPVSQSSSHPVHAWQFCSDPETFRGRAMGEPVMGILGESITLPLALSVSQGTGNVIWMFNTSVISKECEATANPLMKFRDLDKNRVWISGQDYSLKIDQLKLEDAGLYHAFVCSEASRVISMTHVTLLIYRRLVKPKITWKLGPTKDGTCRVSLTCSVEDGGNNVTYTWTPLQKGAIVSQGGSHLNISWRSDENRPNLTCTASNTVSNSSHQFPSGNICSGPEGNMRLWTVLSLMVCLLCFGVFGLCIWKQKRQRSDPVFSSSQAEASADTPGYEKLDIPSKPARQQPPATSDSSSDSNVTTEEDEERPEMPKTINGRDEVYDLVTQEDTECDSASEGQEYDLVTPDDTVVKPMVEGDTEYTQVFFNLQGKIPVSQKKESSVTIYCSVQKPQMVMPPPQENERESPEIPTYENFI